MERVIGHLDLDYFYAQVEEVENPALKTKPVLVCVFSGRTEDSGVVSTANYRAREFGVRSGMPIALAKRKLEGKEAALIPIDHEKYERYSEKVMGVVRRRVDVTEQTGIDEAFFDITKKSGGSYDLATKIASEMKLEILDGERLTCSIGIAPNKVVAKLGSDFRKPNGLTVVRPEEVSSFMGPIPVEKLYGVGPKSSKILSSVGVATIEDLARKKVDELETVFDRKFAVYLWNAANGVDDDPVRETGAATQMSRIITLKRDSREAAEIMPQLYPAVQDVHKQAVEKGVYFRSISVIGILKDLSTKTRSKTLVTPTNDLELMKKEATELMTSLTAEGHDLRRAGVRVSDFSESQTQSSLADFLG